MYLNDGAPAVARYNPHSREEAEANAFAAEFLCASREVLQQWLQNPGADSVSLAQHLGVPVYVVHAQLAEALYWTTVGEDADASEKSARAVADDPSQRQAAECTGRPVLVQAGPGTGKTATLIRRIAYLLETCGAAPEALLVLTFSNDAAEELRERVAVCFGEATAARLEINTFHGFGVAFLHHHGQFLQLDADAAILDEAGQEELVTSLLGKVGCARIITLHDPQETVQEVVRHIGYLKDRLYTPEQYATALALWHPPADQQQHYEAAHEFLAVFRAYEAAKAARQGVDFADLIALPLRILEAHSALVEQYRKKYRWVMVDEYQDVSRAVAALLRQLCGPDNPPWVVGDTRQAIYRFRGAAPENVEQFAHDFPGARVFTLDTNYRSCAEIVQAANQLAILMETPAPAGTNNRERWVAGAGQTALGAPVITVARAASDQAEHAGIAAHIATWLGMGVPARDIAVLARRNIDVRNIALALGKKGIRAITAGLATPEGVAGDLAAIATLVDQPRAALPRLAFALGRGRFDVQTINAVVKRVLETLDSDGTFAHDGYGEGDSLAVEMRRVSHALQSKRGSGDAFTMMCTLLFDASAYLRRLLEQPAGAEYSAIASGVHNAQRQTTDPGQENAHQLAVRSTEQWLALGELITSLSRAAGYRFVHPEAAPQVSRRGFGQYFRASLCSRSPCLLPPKPTADAVRVMTCHAAKGLEFPCVIVAGQTLAQAPQAYPWLSPGLTPPGEADARQADALFFVGVTRAQRTLLVTYATSAGGMARSRARQATPLLSRWHTTHALPTVDLVSQPAVRKRIVMGAVWGGALRGALASRALDKYACALRTYLEEYLSVRFPTSMRPLYPIFFEVIRRVMGHIVRRAHAIGTQVPQDEAADLLRHEWPMPETADHPHHPLYFNLAREYIARFAGAYVPQPRARAHLDPIIGEEETGLLLRLDLLARYLAEDGAPVAITFRPESLATKQRPQGLLWSGLSPAHRLSFVLLKQRTPRLRPYVFSAQDGNLYPYQWTSNPEDFKKEAAHITGQIKALAQGVFTTTVQAWACDRCPVRVVCPYWLGALGETDADR
jgi:superfamily I DNA/RNA helicase